MKTQTDFKFTLNVSNEPYECKGDALACLSSAGAKAIGKNKMAFKEQTITVSEFLGLATSGYTFCNLYQFDESKKYWIENKKHQKYLMYPTYQRGAAKGCMKVCFKRDDFFKSAQVVFVDVDLTKYQTVEEYISVLRFKPTCVYMSYSDGLEKHGVVSRRFHLVYIFEKPLDKEEFLEVSSSLTKLIESDTNEVMDDDCGTRLSQYMNGCFGNDEIFCSYILYDYYDIINKNNSKDNIDNNNNKEDYILLRNAKNEHPANEGESVLETGNSSEAGNKDLVSEQLIYELKSFDNYDNFMKYNRHKYRIFWRAEKEWTPIVIDGNTYYYQFTDENYFTLYYNTDRVPDGSKRRKKLFERMCLRKYMFPDIDADTLLVNAYDDVVRFFEVDSDLTLECLVMNVENAMKLSTEEIYDAYSEAIDYLKEGSPSKGIIYKVTGQHTTSERNTIYKKIRYSLIDGIYDKNKSVAENARVISDKLFPIKERALYYYLEDRNINVKEDRDSEILSAYDFSLSLRKNLEILKGLGIKVSLGKLSKLIKEYNIDNISESEEDIEDYKLLRNAKIEHPNFTVEVAIKSIDSDNQIIPNYNTSYSMNFCY